MKLNNMQQNNKNKQFGTLNSKVKKFGQWSEDENDGCYIPSLQQNRNHLVESCPEISSTKSTINTHKKYDSHESDKDSNSRLHIFTNCFKPKEDRRDKSSNGDYSEYKSFTNNTIVNLTPNYIYQLDSSNSSKKQKKKVPPPVPPPPSIHSMRQNSSLYNSLNISKSDISLYKQNAINQIDMQGKVKKSNSSSYDTLNTICSASPVLSENRRNIPSPRRHKRHAPPPPVSDKSSTLHEMKFTSSDSDSNYKSPQKDKHKFLYDFIDNSQCLQKTLSSENSKLPPTLPVKRLPHDTKTLFGYCLKERQNGKAMTDSQIDHYTLSEDSSTEFNIKNSHSDSSKTLLNSLINDTTCSGSKFSAISATNLSSRDLFYSSLSLRKRKKIKNRNTEPPTSLTSNQRRERRQNSANFCDNPNSVKKCDTLMDHKGLSTPVLMQSSIQKNVKKQYMNDKDISPKQINNPKISISIFPNDEIFSPNFQTHLRLSKEISKDVCKFENKDCFVPLFAQKENFPEIYENIVVDRNCEQILNANNIHFHIPCSTMNIQNTYDIKPYNLEEENRENKMHHNTLIVSTENNFKNEKFNSDLSKCAINGIEPNEIFTRNKNMECQLKLKRPLSVLDESQELIYDNVTMKNFKGSFIDKNKETENSDKQISESNSKNEKLNFINQQNAKNLHLKDLETQTSVPEIPYILNINSQDKNYVCNDIKSPISNELNSATETESLFTMLELNAQNSNSIVCSSAKCSRLGENTALYQTPQTSTTSEVSNLPQLGPNGVNKLGDIQSCNCKMSIPEKLQITTLFKQLETAIANGQHKKAAILARKLALHKVSCSLNYLSLESSDSEKPIIVNLYIEDKSLHQGPFPLEVYPSMTLGILKNKLEKEFSFPKELQRWILDKRLATDDDKTLSNYNVTQTGCPVFLYLMCPNSISKPSASSLVSFFKSDRNEMYNEYENTNLCNSVVPTSSNSVITLVEENITNLTCVTCGALRNSNKINCQVCEAANHLQNTNLEESVDISDEASIMKETDHKHKEAERNYQLLIQFDSQDLIPNAELFDCPVCFTKVQVGEGVVLRDCLHQFCKECLANAIEYAEEAIIKCLFRNDDYSCDCQLQQREIKALVPAHVFERYLHRSMTTAESRSENSFHCKSPDCHGWCVYEDAINTFSCPVCLHVNCLTCQAIHEGLNCRQYQDELQYQSERNKEAKETMEYLESMVKEGKAMPCPKCDVIVMKRWGCDWLKCSVCQTEICWITKQPRWGPEGHGDTSAGCKCGVNGVRCHPQCNYCH